MGVFRNSSLKKFTAAFSLERKVISKHAHCVIFGLSYFRPPQYIFIFGECLKKYPCFQYDLLLVAGSYEAHFWERSETLWTRVL